MTTNKFQLTDKSALFLDRDGVINQKIENDYIKNFDEFSFTPQAPEAIAEFSRLFKRIFIVTNQQGIGKGLMTLHSLEMIHKQMIDKISEAGGRIDKIYFCPDLAGSGSFFRKPEIGMALLARKEFPDISLKKSVMIGDSISDMKFGKKCGMKTVFIAKDSILSKKFPALIDYRYNSLIELSNSGLLK